MAEVFSAIEAAASAGAMATSRACCAEFEEKHPNAQGTDTTAASESVTPRGQIKRLSAIAPMPIITAREAPSRSIWRDINMLPTKPNTPNHISSRLNSPGVMLIFCL